MMQAWLWCKHDCEQVQRTSAPAPISLPGADGAGVPFSLPNATVICDTSMIEQVQPQWIMKQAWLWTGPADIYTCTHLCTRCWWCWGAFFPPPWRAPPLVWTWPPSSLTSSSECCVLWHAYFSLYPCVCVCVCVFFTSSACCTRKPGCLHPLGHQVSVAFCDAPTSLFVLACVLYFLLVQGCLAAFIPDIIKWV